MIFKLIPLAVGFAFWPVRKLVEAVIHAPYDTDIWGPGGADESLEDALARQQAPALVAEVEAYLETQS